MARLTRKLDNGSYAQNYTTGDGFMVGMTEMMQKLGRLEDLQEAGQLVKLPCKVGDTVWVYCSLQNEIEEKTIWEICIGSKHDTLIFTDSMQFTVWDKDWEYAFQNFIFHTREEAEAALKGGDLNE